MPTIKSGFPSRTRQIPECLKPPNIGARPWMQIKWCHATYSWSTGSRVSEPSTWLSDGGSHKCSARLHIRTCMSHERRLYFLYLFGVEGWNLWSLSCLEGVYKPSTLAIQMLCAPSLSSPPPQFFVIFRYNTMIEDSREQPSKDYPVEDEQDLRHWRSQTVIMRLYSCNVRVQCIDMVMFLS